METSSRTKLPALVVFDLDRTLWPFQLDKHAVSPFLRGAQGDAIDALGQRLEPYSGAAAALRATTALGCALAVASRAEDTVGAFQLLEIFFLSTFFVHKEVYPVPKAVHFRELQRKTGIMFRDMAFFDDDERNIRQARWLGVSCFQVPGGGVTKEFVQQSLRAFAEESHSG